MNPIFIPARPKTRWYWGFIAALSGICVLWLTEPLWGILCTMFILVIVEPVVEGDDMK
jgi:hypothetical protein